MKKFISFKLAGSDTEYEVPTEILALKLVAQLMNGRDHTEQERIRGEVDIFLEDDSNVASYASNNIQWADVAGYARAVKVDTKPNVIEGWYAPHEEPRALVVPEGMDSRLPMDAYLSLMWQMNAAISVTVLQKPGGETNAGFFLIRGDQEQIEAYMQVCQQLGQQMTAQPEGAPKPARIPYNH